MLAKSQIKFIRSLHTGKFRQIHGQYIAEGAKLAIELIHSQRQIVALYVTSAFAKQNASLLRLKNVPCEVVSDDELKKISTLTTPNQALAVVACHDTRWDPDQPLEKGFYVVAENLQDPGNLGTIIRAAEWFGVSAVFCSKESVDVFNPKVVQASMGSVFRLPVYYTDLKTLLQQNQHLTKYAAVLSGKNVYHCNLDNHAILVIGNESKGISDEIKNLCTEKITIPKFGNASSLNAAIACSILLGLWRR